MKYPTTFLKELKRVLSKIIDVFSQDKRIVGIGANGSYATNSMDKYSDLDLVFAVSPNSIESLMSERIELVKMIDGNVASFSGEHVGEPRLIIALHEPDAVHVDFKFVSLPDAVNRVDDTKIL